MGGDQVVCVYIRKEWEVIRWCVCILGKGGR